MDANTLKALQAPFKDKYRQQPDSAVITLEAEGNIGEGVTCSVAERRPWRCEITESIRDVASSAVIVPFCT